MIIGDRWADFTWYAGCCSAVMRTHPAELGAFQLWHLVFFCFFFKFSLHGLRRTKWHLLPLPNHTCLTTEQETTHTANLNTRYLSAGVFLKVWRGWIQSKRVCCRLLYLQAVLIDWLMVAKVVLDHNGKDFKGLDHTTFLIVIQIMSRKSRLFLSLCYCFSTSHCFGAAADTSGVDISKIKPCWVHENINEGVFFCDLDDLTLQTITLSVSSLHDSNSSSERAL